jgi:hypothetical protein
LRGQIVNKLVKIFRKTQVREASRKAIYGFVEVHGQGEVGENRRGVSVISVTEGIVHEESLKRTR